MFANLVATASAIEKRRCRTSKSNCREITSCHTNAAQYRDVENVSDRQNSLTRYTGRPWFSVRRADEDAAKAEKEQAARLAAEVRVAELEGELRRLRGE